MDDDCLPEPDALEKLLEADALLGGDYGWLSSVALWATFVSLFLCAETVRRVGLPIREYFIWGDDIEYTRRIAVREKLLCFVAGQSQVIHAMADNNGSSIANDNQHRIDRYRFAYRNDAFTYRQEGVKGVCYYLAKCGLNFCRILVKAPDQRGKRIRVLLGGMVRGAFFRPEIEFIKNEQQER